MPYEAGESGRPDEASAAGTATALLPGRLLAIRRQILAGTYLTDDKLAIASDRILGVLQAERIGRSTARVR